MKESASNRIVLLIPVYDDWESVQILLPSIDRALASYPAPVHVLLVDDGSSVPASDYEFEGLYEHIVQVDILHLKRNLGHQRAIAIALYHAHAHLSFRALLIMDGDGEDRAEDVPKLLAEFDRLSGARIVFAQRMKRLESVTFRVFYHLYRLAHLLLTGVAVRVGNFSVLPFGAVASLMVNSDLWNHYAASVFRSRIPYRLLPLPRGARLRGQSKMNFFSLLIHGLSAISVFGDVVSVRLLAVAGVGFLATLPLFLLVDAGTAWWALVIIAWQALTAAILLVFRTVGSRSHMSFLPARDAHYFVQEAQTVYAAHDQPQLHRLRVGHL
jgi:glycosyltransferase involved in cell wall biosynthesis